MCCDGFTAVSDHLVLLREARAVKHHRGFTAVSDHLVLLLISTAAASGRRFTAVSDHLVLLQVLAAAIGLMVSQPCQITWFSYRGNRTPP